MGEPPREGSAAPSPAPRGAARGGGGGTAGRAGQGRGPASRWRRSHRSSLFPPGIFYLLLPRFVLLHPSSVAVRSAAFCFLQHRRAVFSRRSAAFSLALIIFSLTLRAVRPRSVWRARRKRFRGRGGRAGRLRGRGGSRGGRGRPPARSAPQLRSGLLSPRGGRWRRGCGGTGRRVLLEVSSLSILTPPPGRVYLTEKCPRDRARGVSADSCLFL